jgi:hypothetical protein
MVRSNGEQEKKIMGRWFFFVFFLVALAVQAPSANAKVYVWVDDNNRTHYCNDLDDVPEKYKSKVRTIETQSPNVAAQKAAGTQPQPVKPRGGSTPPSQNIQAAEGNEQGLNEVLSAYQAKRNELRQYRRSGKDTNSPEYVELRQQLEELKKQMTESRPVPSPPEQ